MPKTTVNRLSEGINRDREIIPHTTIVTAGFDKATVDRIVRPIDLNEYKRRQATPGLKVTSKAFGVGRRMPIAQRYLDQ